MKLYLVINKAIHNLCWARKLYTSESLTPYIGYESALLNAAELLDLSNCWVRAFKCLGLEECSNECLKPINLLSEIPVYGWLWVEEGLKSLARVTSVTYSKIEDALLELIKTDLGVKPWRELSIGLAYSPNLKEPLAINAGVEQGSLYLCVFASSLMTAQGVTDSVIGEALMEYVRKGLIPLPPQLGEEMMKALAPSGELSKALKLSLIAKPCLSKVCRIVSEYFRKGRNVEKGLITYLVKNLKHY